MIVSNDKVISVTYTLREDSNSGEVVETVGEEKPLMFLYGTGNLLPRFEENLDGLKEGDDFSFSLAPAEAYGNPRKEAVVDLPKNVFEVDGKIDDSLLQLGNVVPMMDKDGNRLNGIVSEIKDETVTMDFNHPMAGKNLHFTGKVVGIREATANEKEHGHVHNEDSCNNCDCGGNH